MRSVPFAVAALLAAGAIATACSSSSGDAPGADPDGGSSSTTDPSAPGASCADGKKDGDESDVDCGGSCSKKCGALGACASSGDCGSDLQCTKGVCASANASNGTKDGDESDVDCGGSAAPPCDDGKTCSAAADCLDKICKSGTCAPPSPTDGVKNGAETGVDCGGPAAPACADTLGCKVGSDCTSKICTAGACAAPSSMDGQKNGAETDVDCGGTGAPACADGKSCGAGDDCTSKVCTGGVCQVPTGSDGVKNGDESDVDCGGTTTGAAKCATAKQCAVHADCVSNGCSFDKKCATNPSCTAQGGGYTCGEGEGATGDCCAQAPISGYPTTTIDKYGVTAGRMRAFVERLNGDVRTFAQTVPGWSAAYNGMVPSTVAEANTILGPYWDDAPNDPSGGSSKRSCAATSFGGHTYYTPGDSLQKYTQAQLDPKALNCVGWHIAKAFCAWDNGRLATRPEYAAAFRSGMASTTNGKTTMPWSWHDTSDYDISEQDPRLNHDFSYGYPGAAPFKNAAGGVTDITWYIAPPGRHPLGYTQAGAADMAGNLLPWVEGPGYGEYSFVWTESWEHHGLDVNNVGNWRNGTAPEAPNGYYAIGLRCVHDQ